VNKKELDFWTDTSAGDRATGPTKGFFAQVAMTVGPYVSSGQVKTFEGEAQASGAWMVSPMKTSF
jgi:hypothetical protein